MRRGYVLVWVALACGCASVAQPETDAVIVEPSAETRAELLRAVSTALGRSDLTLADDALTRQSTLSLERTPPRDAAGRRLGGRELDRPEEFRLVRAQGQCILVHLNTGRKYALGRTRCEPRE